MKKDILFMGTITVKNDPATFSLLRLVFRYSAYVNVKCSSIYQTCILLQWEFFHSRVWSPIMGTQSFHFSLLWSPFHPREVWLFVPFPKLRLGTSFILQTTRSRFCLHGNQGSITCIHVSSRLSPKRSNVNCSIPGKSLQTGRTSQQ